MNKKTTILFVTLLVTFLLNAQNLLVNGDAEISPFVGNGWTQISGDWQQRTTNPIPQNGSNYFFAGANTSAELYQEIDVSANATTIDASQQLYNFSGYLRSFNGSDQSSVKVEYLDVLNVILESYNTGLQSPSTEWELFEDSRIAPVGTRKIKVTLMSVRNSGTNNDGYFDNLQLIEEIYTQGEYESKTSTTFLCIENSATTSNVSGTVRKEYPFVQLGNGNWSTVDLSLVDIDIKTDIGIGIYVQLNENPVSDVSSLCAYYETVSNLPQISNFLPNEEITLTPESYNLKNLIASTSNKDQVVEIGFYIKAGAAMRARAGGITANIFSAPSNFRNDSNPGDIDVALFKIVNNQIEVAPGVPDIIQRRLQDALNDNTAYTIKDNGFKINIAKLGFNLNYSKYDTSGVFFRNYSNQGQTNFSGGSSHSRLAIKFDFTTFMDYFISKALKHCNGGFCNQIKTVKGLFLRYNKNLYVAKVYHRGFSVRAFVTSDFKYTTNINLNPKIRYNLNVGSLGALSFNVYSKANPNTILRTESGNSLLLGFDEIAKFIHPGVPTNSVFDFGRITSRIEFEDTHDFDLSQTSTIKKAEGIDFEFFRGSVYPSKEANAVVSFFTLGQTTIFPVHYGPFFSADTFQRTELNGFYNNESLNFTPSYYYSGRPSKTGSFNLNFTGDILDESVTDPEGFEVKDIYPFKTLGTTFTPDTITTEGDYVITVDNGIDTPFTFNVIGVTDALEPQISNQSNYDALMGGYFVSLEEPIKYHVINTSSLNNATNPDGSLNPCAFVLDDINAIKATLVDMGSSPLSDVTLTVLNEDNTVDLSQIYDGRHEIVYTAKDHYDNETKFTRYLDIVNDFIPTDFTINTPAITRMVDENGEFELTLGAIDLYDDAGAFVETIGVPYSINESEKFCSKDFFLNASQTKFNCNNFGLNIVDVTLSVDGQQIIKPLEITIINNPLLEFTANTMYINKDATGNNSGVTMEDGFIDLNHAINVLPCRIASVDYVYIKYGDYFAFSEDVDYSTFSDGNALNTYNKIYVTKDMVFESVGGISTLKLSNFYIEDGVTATFRNIDFTNSTIIAGKDSKVVLENCNFFANQFAIVSVGSVEAYNTTFVNSQGGSVNYEGPAGFSSGVGYPLFKIEDPNGDCQVTNIFGEQQALQDISLLYLYGGEETSKFVNCTFHNNVTTFNGAPAGMYCNTQVEFSNCLFDSMLSSQAYEGDFFGIGSNVQITLNNNFITGQEPFDPFRPGFEDSICNNPSITCNNNTFFDDVEYLGWFPGPNFYDFEDAVGDDSDGNAYNYNMRLKEGSPAIDSGDDNYYQPPVTVTTDLGGESRFSGTHIDVGAYEYQQQALSNDNTVKDKVLNIYPVPFNNEINISTIFTGTISYSLFDAVGNLIQKEELQSTTRKINVKNLSSGVYILKLQLEHNIISQKIIKQ